MIGQDRVVRDDLVGLGKVLRMHIHFPGSGKSAPDKHGIPGSFVVNFPWSNFCLRQGAGGGDFKPGKK